MNRQARRRALALNRKSNHSTRLVVQSKEQAPFLPSWRTALLGAAALGVALGGVAMQPSIAQAQTFTAGDDSESIFSVPDGATLNALAGDDNLFILIISSNPGDGVGETGAVLGDAGEDTIALSVTSVGRDGAGTVSGGDDADSIDLFNSYIGFSATATGVVLGDAGDDTITIDNSDVGGQGAGTVSGGDGADSIGLSDGSNIGANGMSILGPAATGVVLGDAGDDTITINNSDVGDGGTGTVSGGDGADSIALSNGSNIGLNGLSLAGPAATGVVLGDAGDDTITLDQSYVGRFGAGTVSGGDGADSIALSNSSVIGFSNGGTGVVLGDAGDDTITLDQSVVGFYSAGTVSGGDGADSIALSNSSSIGAVPGSTGVILGDAGDDTITIDNSYVGNDGTGTVSGGDGADSIALTGTTSINSTSQVLGDAGNDTVSIDSSVIRQAGAVIEGGADLDQLAFNALTDATVSGGEFLNFEQLAKNGAATLTLDGAQTFSDKVDVNAGTLSVTGALTTQTTNVNAGTLTVTATGSITNTVNVIGGTALNSGTLATVDNQAGGIFTNNAGGTAGAVSNAGTASNAGTIASLTNTAGTFTNTNLITGAANVIGGTLNTSGTVGGGSVNAGTINASGIFNGPIINNDTFNVIGALAGNGDVTNNSIFNVIDGSFSGLTSFTNSATTTVGAGQALSAATIIQNDGLLTVNGTLNGDTTVNGGTLQGVGVFNGNVTNNNGGTITPGNSIGTQTVNGDLTLNAGSTTVIELSQGASDLIDVNGAVAINGATLQLEDLAPAIDAAVTDLVIINNDGADAISGSGFATVLDNLAFVTPTVTLTGGDGNDVALDLDIDVDLTTVADTFNQQQVAIGFGSLPTTDPGVQTLTAAFAPLTAEQARAGIDSLSGEVHAAELFTLNSNGLFIGDSITNVLDGFATGEAAAARNQQEAGNVAIQALALAPGETATRVFGADLIVEQEAAPVPDKNRFVFARGLFRDINIDADGNGDQTDIQSRGFLAGGGLSFNDRFSAGLSAGYLNTDLETRNSETETDSAIVNGFARLTQGAFDATGVLGYIYSDISSERNITVGALNATADGETDANTVFGSVELGYTALLNRVAFRPFISGGFSLTSRDGFTETGAGVANLVVASTTDSIGQLSIGASASSSFKLGRVLIAPRVEVALDQLIGDVTPSSTQRFQPSGTFFNVINTSPSRSRGRISAGFASKISKNITGYIEYQGIFSSNDQEHAARTGIKLKF
ncbi:MAG: autotransporter domain-containing protein [Hyphomicrobiales bacterium]